MILEHAELTVDAARGEEFALAMCEARDVIKQAPGFVSLEMLHGIERPNTYLLLIMWERLEDHTEGFRTSELFRRWREIIGPFFLTDPVVEHFEPRLG